MEGTQETVATVAGGGGGPAPFLLKTYDMVDDSATDDVVSWSPSRKSFIVWNPPEFARTLLSTYFKHNNFSSFIRQLNTYVLDQLMDKEVHETTDFLPEIQEGFRKIDPERWEFANEDFVKDQKHLLKNIHRRKPIHSHSIPQGRSDQERAAFEEEIDKLSREKTMLDGDLEKFRQQSSTAKLELEDLNQRVSAMEQRQENLLSFLEKSVQSPFFVERLVQKLESMDVSTYNKKRRLPEVDFQPVQENMLVDDHNNSKPEVVNGFHQDFCNKLRLELSPCISDINLLSHSTQSSNEEIDGPQRMMCEEWTKSTQVPCGALTSPETLELSDTGASFNLIDSCALKPECIQSLSQCLTSIDEGDGVVSCNLTLASSPFSAVKSPCSVKVPEITQEVDKDANREDQVINAGPPVPQSNRNRFSDESELSSSHNNDKKATPNDPVRMNDQFWEQFLTERPGCNDEVCSSFKANTYKEQENKMLGLGMAGNMNSAEHLTL